MPLHEIVAEIEALYAGIKSASDDAAESALYDEWCEKVMAAWPALRDSIARQGAQDGWRLVLVEPTPEHFARAVNLGRPLLNMDKPHFEKWAAEYRAMLAAAPRVEQGNGVTERLTVSRSLAERTEAMFRSVDPTGHLAIAWREALSTLGTQGGEG